MFWCPGRPGLSLRSVHLDVGPLRHRSAPAFADRPWVPSSWPLNKQDRSCVFVPSMQLKLALHLLLQIPLHLPALLCCLSWAHTPGTSGRMGYNEACGWCLLDLDHCQYPSGGEVPSPRFHYVHACCDLGSKREGVWVLIDQCLISATLCAQPVQPCGLLIGQCLTKAPLCACDCSLPTPWPLIGQCLTTMQVHFVSAGHRYYLEGVNHPSLKEMTTKFQTLNAAKGLGPIRVLSALQMSDPSHDPALHAHVGRHAEILATVTRRWLEQRFLADLVRTVTGAIREAAEGGHRYVTILFYCKSGQHRSVAAVELASVLFMHVPGLVVLVDHLNAPEWKFRSCMGQCPACRQRPLQNPDATPILTKLYAEFVKVWNWRGGSGLDPILGNMPVPPDPQGDAGVPPVPADEPVPGSESAPPSAAQDAAAAASLAAASPTQPASSSAAASTPFALQPASTTPSPFGSSKHGSRSHAPTRTERGPEASLWAGPRAAGARPPTQPPPSLVLEPMQPPTGMPGSRENSPAPVMLVDDESFRAMLLEIKKLTPQQGRVLFGVLRQQPYTLQDCVSMACQTEVPADPPVPGVSMACQTEAPADPPVPGGQSTCPPSSSTPPADGQPGVPPGPTASAAASVLPPGIPPGMLRPSHGDHPLATQLPAIAQSQWPWLPREHESLYSWAAKQWRRPPPAYVDWRRTDDMSNFAQVLGGRKKSYGYWLVKSLRVYVRILPRSQDSSVPEELKPYDLLRTVVAWLGSRQQWTVVESREPFTSVGMMPVDPDHLLQVCILQPEDPEVGRLGVYKGAQHQHCMHNVVALGSRPCFAVYPPFLSSWPLSIGQHGDVLCATGHLPSHCHRSSASLPALQDPHLTCVMHPSLPCLHVCVSKGWSLAHVLGVHTNASLVQHSLVMGQCLPHKSPRQDCVIIRHPNHDFTCDCCAVWLEHGEGLREGIGQCLPASVDLSIDPTRLCQAKIRLCQATEARRHPFSTPVAMVTIHILTYGHRYLLGRDSEASQEAVHAAVAADMRDREQAPFYVVSASHWGNVQVSTDMRAHIGKHPELV